MPLWASGAGAGGGSLSQGSGVSWPLELFPQGSNKNLRTAASEATCQVWPGAGPPLLALPAPELPRVSVIVFHEHVEWSRWVFLRFPQMSFEGTVEV